LNIWKEITEIGELSEEEEGWSIEEIRITDKE